MTIAQEEIFGPVVCVIPYDDDDDAVAIANDSRYGLSGSVWGPDAEQAKDVARRIHSGNVGVNQHILDPAGPFGGFKQSGLGRENGIEGIEAYVELQTHPLRAMKIQAAISASAAAPFEIAEVELDDPRRDEVLVKLSAVGVCHSDLTMKAVWPEAISPIVLGHEGAGVVAAVGADVSGVRPGDHVVLSYRSCGACRAVRGRAPAVLPRLPDAERDRLAPGRLADHAPQRLAACTGRTSGSRASRRTRWPTSRTSWWSARRSTSASPPRWAAACRPARGPCSTSSLRRRRRRWSCSAPAASGCRR